MTMQIKDDYCYQNDSYECLDIQNKKQFFDPHNYNFQPESISTSCWKGYFCSYIFCNSRLKLMTLNINDRNSYYPIINGVISNYANDKKPQLEKQQYHVYSNINMDINYTGKIILAKDLLENKDGYCLYFRRNRHIGLNQYNIILELELKDGLLIKCFNHSENMKQVREILNKYPQPKSGLPSERERYSEDILLSVYKDFKWWMHREITEDMKHSEQQIKI